MTDIRLPAWNPAEPRAWASALGFAYAPLYGHNAIDTERDESGVLLDGEAASAAIYLSATTDSLLSAAVLDETWSANLDHSIGLDRTSRTVFLRRWDEPSIFRKFVFPQSVAGAEQLIAILAKNQPPLGGDVVLHMLRAFRAARALTDADEPRVALEWLNTLLVAAECLELGLIDRGAIEGAASFGALRIHLADVRTGPVGEWLADEPMSAGPAPAVISPFVLEPETATGRRLVPSLLLRHALGPLFQEAHLVIETQARQLAIPGFAPELHGATLRRDVRFTPRSLARALVESAMGRPTGDGHGRLTVLDPACGSGVFLAETVGALIENGFRGPLHLRGFDISPLSVEMARFALLPVMEDALARGIDVTLAIEERDALLGDWGTPDVVAMNPPFAPWGGLPVNEQDQVRAILGPAARGRPDKAMAFLTLAARHVRPNGHIASVIPAAILETEGGLGWRDNLQTLCDVEILGRFEGFGYFKDSFVEPAFAVLRRREPGTDLARPIRVLVAREGHEDAALRFLRRERGAPDTGFDHEDGWDAYVTPPGELRPPSWMPRRRSDRRLMDLVSARGLPTVGQDFRVLQGVRTGANDIFILTARELEDLPHGERRYFRPIAGNSTILHGQLRTAEYVFYPYGDAQISTEAELAARLPWYYGGVLNPARIRLVARAGLNGRPWWGLTWPRPWQYTPRPKIVTSYFGDRGSFSYDAEGRSVVVQGHAWLPQFETNDPNLPDFENSSLPWAYVAILNSLFFERLLASRSPRVQGGQFNLSPRFVTELPLPPIRSPEAVIAQVASGLARVGRSIVKGTYYEADQLEDLVGRAYGVPSTVALDY